MSLLIDMYVYNIYSEYVFCTVFYSIYMFFINIPKAESVCLEGTMLPKTRSFWVPGAASKDGGIQFLVWASRL